MKKSGKILIIDDNLELLTALRICLSPYFTDVDTLHDPNLIHTIIREKSYDLILLDMNFSPGQSTGNEGIYWMNRIKEIDTAAGIVLITAYGDVSLVVKAMREGAIDFILKSWDESKIVSTILSAARLHRSEMRISHLEEKGRQLKSVIDDRYRMYTGGSESMLRVMELVNKVAVTDANVLILGENGTGKELIAREIHRLSKRSHDIFVKIDLGAITESLFESEMFGSRRGAFTDASEDRTGRIEIASGGTLFLDEIGNLTQEMQAKLLGVIQNREITRLGDNRPLRVDIRILSATNRDLVEAVDNMSFREDLFYRLNTIIINLPPLRERRQEILFLADRLLNDINEEYSRSVSLSKDAIRFIENHDWPGNIRELRHVLEKGVILAENNIIKVCDLESGPNKRNARLQDTFRLADNEKMVIESALNRFTWNISRAAKELGINRSTLYEKMARYEISKD